MEKTQYTVEGKEITLYPADHGDMPLVVLNNFSGDGSSVVEALDGLGRAEAKTRQPLLRTVRDHTEAIVAHYEEQGLPVTWELNPGNHFRDAALRSAKGIAAIL